MKLHHKIPKYFVLTNELKCTAHEQFSSAILEGQHLLQTQKKFIILNSSAMNTQLIPEKLHQNHYLVKFTSEDFDMLRIFEDVTKEEQERILNTQKSYVSKEFYLVKLGIDFHGKDNYTFVQCNNLNFEEIYNQPLTKYENWLGFYLAQSNNKFEHFTKKFETFQYLLLSASDVMEGLLEILNSTQKIEMALILDEEAKILQSELNRLILNSNYNDLRFQLHKEEKLREIEESRQNKLMNSSLEDWASDFGSITIDPDSIYDKD